MYIELFASRPPLTFQKSSGSLGKERNVERKILEALQRVATVGGLEKTFQGLRKVFSPHVLTIIIISDSKEEEVEVRIIEPKAFQLVGLEHQTNFLL
jgi:hypothetical protein